MTTHRVLTTLACALTAVLATAWSAAPPPQPGPPAVATTGAPAGRGPGATTTLRTHDGLVRGANHDGYRTFDGMPYAAPPVGGLRWAPPHREAPGPGCGTRRGPRAPARNPPARCPAAAPTRTAST
ncbi:carboxylesterase family protein [Streptomyces sp. PanSC9]|nr:carboxylesterase family protein [Streptomyces sp. PanSC9]